MIGRIAKVDKHLREAEAIVMAELEKRVRTVLRGKNPAYKFCMAMGSASFHDKHGELIDDDKRYMDRTWDLLGEYDEVLRITGNPMKIESPDGPVITDW